MARLRPSGIGATRSAGGSDGPSWLKDNWRAADLETRLGRVGAELVQRSLLVHTSSAPTRRATWFLPGERVIVRVRHPGGCTRRCTCEHIELDIELPATQPRDDDHAALVERIRAAAAAGRLVEKPVDSDGVVSGIAEVLASSGRIDVRVRDVPAGAAPGAVIVTASCTRAASGA